MQPDISPNPKLQTQHRSGSRAVSRTAAKNSPLCILSAPSLQCFFRPSNPIHHLSIQVSAPKPKTSNPNTGSAERRRAERPPGAAAPRLLSPCSTPRAHPQPGRYLFLLVLLFLLYLPNSQLVSLHSSSSIRTSTQHAAAADDTWGCCARNSAGGCAGRARGDVVCAGRYCGCDSATCAAAGGGAAVCVDGHHGGNRHDGGKPVICMLCLPLDWQW